MKDYFTLLARAHKKGKLSHAYLLSGNDETKKEQLLTKFIALALGLQKPKIQANVIEINPEKEEITIGQIRRLKKQLSLSAWDAPCKIGIIRNAESMNQEAQSAFLKLLEEPKGNVFLFLTVLHPALLLNTIRSRAQELRMYQFDKMHGKNTNLLTKLQRLSIGERFAFAERESQDQKALYGTLLNLQEEMRVQLLQELRKGTMSSLHALRNIHEVLVALSQTNVSGRLAMERVLLEL
jgi:DNA polymerase III delta prime subunit